MRESVVCRRATHTRSAHSMGRHSTRVFYAIQSIVVSPTTSPASPPVLSFSRLRGSCINRRQMLCRRMRRTDIAMHAVVNASDGRARVSRRSCLFRVPGTSLLPLNHLLSPAAAAAAGSPVCPALLTTAAAAAAEAAASGEGQQAHTAKNNSDARSKEQEEKE